MVEWHAWACHQHIHSHDSEVSGSASHTPLPPPPQPSPSRREDRPVSFYQLGPSQLPSSAAALVRDAGGLAKDKQRGFVPSLLQNETYGAILSGSPPPTQPAASGSASAPPLPPRNVAKGMY